MSTVEERVSYLEARMEDVGKSLDRIEGLIVTLDQKLDRRFDGVNRLLFTIFVAIIGGLLGIITKLI